KLNDVYDTHLKNFLEVEPPLGPKDQTYSGGQWHYDWYHFHDNEIRDYYRFLRSSWEEIGLREPQVLMTRCESFNALSYGLLPRLDYAQEDGLALSTINLYPKTYGSQGDSTLNTPMKAAHDASLISMSHQQFYKNAGNWLMATETVGGWFPGTEVSL